MRKVTTAAYGVRLPIVQRSDNLIEIIVNSLKDAQENQNLTFKDQDIIGITEALVARAENNYATVDDIALDIKEKFEGKTVGVVFPILSRNRFSLILKAIAQGAKKVIVQLSFPTDEVGNRLIDDKELYNKNINPFSDILSEKEFREVFGFETKHVFTNLDYIEFYKSISDNIEIIFSNNPICILNYTKDVIVSSIHTRERDKELIVNAGGENVITLAEIMNKPSEKHGYNELYGVLGTNKATDDEVKLFPRTSSDVVNKLKSQLKETFDVNFEVIVYGDGAFKDPVGKIWELADPVSAIAYSNGLKGTPNELKIKYIADNKFKHLRGQELSESMIKMLEEKDSSKQDNALSEGTTPRQISDLVASLCDLVSGSGDKGTPVVLIQGYFDNYSSK